MKHTQALQQQSPKPRLLDQLRERLRYRHYSASTEKLYTYWVRFFIRWSGMRHPQTMGAAEVEAFLTMLATQRQVSPSIHTQASLECLAVFVQRRAANQLIEDNFQ